MTDHVRTSPAEDEHARRRAVSWEAFGEARAAADRLTDARIDARTAARDALKAADLAAELVCARDQSQRCRYCARWGTP